MEKLTKYVTEDGSITYRNNLVDETYHTKSGAVQEAIEKHAQALILKEIKMPVIFDVCFGLGYNAAAAIDSIKKINSQTKIKIYCFENDKDILGKVLETKTQLESYDIITNFVKHFLNNDELIYEENNICMVMCFGDARQTIKDVKEKADYIFFDPFSPKKQPEMWEKDFLNDIYNKTNYKGKLSTYSFARIVKDNLKNAGFYVIAGPIVGRRSPSTIAIKEEKIKE